jgi:hypothetical protein
MARQASHHRATGTPPRTGKYRAAWASRAHASFGGVSLPSAGRAGWFHGTDHWAEGEFFRYQLTSVELLTRPS